MANFFDRQFVYHPEAWQERDWRRLSGLPLKDVWIEAVDGVRVFGWFVEAPKAPAVLLWCHGNAGNIVHRLDNVHRLHDVGLSTFLFDYRGYGKSEGSPSEPGLYKDAQAAYTYLTQTRRIPAQRLVLFGRSLGAAVAAHLASTRPAAGLVLESAFPSIAAIARAHTFGLPSDWLMEAEYDLEETLQAVSIPLLVIHGDRDTIAPFALGQRVFEAAREPKIWYPVRGAGHNDLYHVGGVAYFKRLRRFAEQVTG